MAVHTREHALKNELVRLECKFLYNGELANPLSQPLVEIYDEDGVTLLESLSAIRESTGLYYVDWYVPADVDLGTYYDKWTFQWQADKGIEEKTMAINITTFDNYINFIGRGISNNISDKATQLLFDLKNFFIYEACHIPMYWEQAMRVQEEGNRTPKQAYHQLTLENGIYDFSEGDIYFFNGQKYTVTTYSAGDIASSSSSVTSNGWSSCSSSSFSSSSSLNSSSSGSSNSSSSDSSSSSLSSLSSLNSSSSSSSSVNSSSSSSSSTSSSFSGIDEDVDSCDDVYVSSPVLTVKGSCDNPISSGTMTKVSGDGPDNFTFTSTQTSISRKSTIYNLVFRNWDREFKPIVRLNGRITEDGWYCDYDGKIYFDRQMTPEDVVEVTYKFSCFSTQDLLGFIRFGLMQMNAVPPASSSYTSLDVAPFIWNAPILLAAAIQALRRAIFAMTVLQEKRAIYGGAGNDEWAKTAMSNFQTLYESYNQEWDEMKKDVKKILPGIGVNVTPMYTLPGGRSRWFRYLYKG